MYQEKKHVICDTASDPGKYEAVVDISNKHKIFIRKHCVLHSLQ
jgi:hypothetical protein